MPRNLTFMKTRVEGPTDLLELELNRSGIHRCDGIRHLLTDTKSLVFRLPWEIDEQGVRVTVYDLRAPLLSRIDYADGLLRTEDQDT